MYTNKPEVDQEEEFSKERTPLLKDQPEVKVGPPPFGPFEWDQMN